jgi:hypothetical protein
MIVNYLGALEVTHSGREVATIVLPASDRNIHKVEIGA